ncbi:MAG: FHA domain-containing protein [Actinomycetota bacterium]
MSIERIWEKVRNWLDQNQDEEILEKSVRTTASTIAEKQVTQLLINIKSKALNIKTIHIEGEFYLPPVYKVYISSFDYNNLLQSEREFTERKLEEIILIDAKKTAQGAKLTTEKLKVKILENPTLENGEVVVFTSDSLDAAADTKAFQNDDKTVEIEESGTIDVEDVDFEPLYWLEVWEDEKKIGEFPILKKHITIGRATKDSAANVRLSTENKAISSLHAAIKYVSKSDITIEAMHKNITKVGNTIISNGKPDLPRESKLDEGDKIQIFNYRLMIRFE